MPPETHRGRLRLAYSAVPESTEAAVVTGRSVGFWDDAPDNVVVLVATRFGKQGCRRDAFGPWRPPLLVSSTAMVIKSPYQPIPIGPRGCPRRILCTRRSPTLVAAPSSCHTPAQHDRRRNLSRIPETNSRSNRRQCSGAAFAFSRGARLSEYSLTALRSGKLTVSTRDVDVGQQSKASCRNEALPDNV